MSGAALLTGPLRDLVESHEQQDRDDADRKAADGHARLLAFDRHPAGLRKAHAARAACDVECKKAAAQLADAQAAYAQASNRENQLGYDLTSALIATRRAAVSPWRYALARERMMEALEAFRRDPDNWPAGDASKVLARAVQMINAFTDGSSDPAPDIDAWTTAVFQEFDRQIAAARQAHSVAHATAAADAIARRIHS